MSDDLEHEGAFFFSMYVILEQGKHQGPVNMLLDTGAGRSIMGEDDLTKLGVEISRLPQSTRPIAGWGGTTESFVLQSPCLVLIDDEDQSEMFEMPEMLCGKNPRQVKSKAGQKRFRTVSIPSVIGRDFLRAHSLIAHIDIKRNEVYLFKE